MLHTACPFSLDRESMADPVSLAASLVALIHAVRVGGKGLAKLKSCYNAPPEIAQLRTEVASLEQLLGSVRDFVHGDSGPMIRHRNDLLIAPVDLAAARMGSVNKILSSPAFGLGRLSDSNKACLTILRYGKRLGTLEREIKESVQDIGVCLTLISA